MAESFKIIYMGTPDFAVPPLKFLSKTKHEIALVVTQPDRPKGRGKKILPPPVKKAAVKYGYPVIQPESVRDQDFYEKIGKIKPDIIVVIAYGHILTKRILDMPRLGAVNIHASILPKLRGPAPIHRAIINGEKETGVTSMLMDTGMDTGDILLCEKTPVYPDDDAGSLHDRLSLMGAEVLIKTIGQFEKGRINPIPQDHEKSTYAPMLKKNEGRIDWSLSAEKLDCFIRGMSPWPGAFTFCDKKRFKIFRGKPVLCETDEKPGTVLKGFDNELKIATGNGALSILEIQGASGKRLSTEEFLRGHKISPGSVFY